MSNNWEPTGEVRIHVVVWHHPTREPSIWGAGEYRKDHLEQCWRRWDSVTLEYEHEWRPLTVHRSRKAYKV